MEDQGSETRRGLRNRTKLIGLKEHGEIEVCAL